MVRSLYLIILFCIIVGCNSNPQAWEALVEPQDTVILYFDTVAFRNTFKAMRQEDKENGCFYVSHFDSLGNMTTATICDEDEYAKIVEDDYTRVWIKTSFGYREERRYTRSHIVEFYNFYSNGIISSKGVVFNNDILVGKYVEYNDKGKPIGAKDYNAGYSFAADSVLNFVRQRISNKDRLHFRVEKKRTKTYNPIWIVSWSADYNTYTYTLNGQTGEILEEKID